MKILLVSSRFPFPLEKGDKLRLFYQIRELSKYHEIILCSLTTIQISKQELSALEPFCSKIYILKLSKYRVVIRLIRSFLKKLPFSIGYFYSQNVQKKLNQIIKDELPDHIYCNLVRTTEYVKDVDIDKTLDYMDAFSTIMRKRISISNFVSKSIFRREAILLKHYEEKIFYSFDNHCIISDQDRSSLQFRNADNIDVIPNGIDLDFFKLNESVKKEFDIVFVGNLGYHPNIIAVQFLIEEIMPLLLKNNPNIKILIAGARPTKQILSLASKNIIIEGWLEDIRYAYWKSKIMVAPIFQGAGQQNKILEAMACGVPCITTSIVNNPYQALHGETILIADNKIEFANRIEMILKQDDLYNEMIYNSLEFAKKYSWEAFGQKLNKLVEKGNW